MLYPLHRRFHSWRRNTPFPLLAALHDVDIVSYQADYQDYRTDFSGFFQVNTVGTSLLHELIVQEKLKVKKVIVASSQAVYGEGQYDCSVHGFFQPVPRSQEQFSVVSGVSGELLCKPREGRSERWMGYGG